MKWPAMVCVENSDELEIIESAEHWDTFLATLDTDCQLILSDGMQFTLAFSHQNKLTCIAADTLMDVATAIELARKHMAAQAHCCVSKFYAPTVAAVITALVQLEEE